MRSLGKPISQKGLGKRVKKSTNQLKAELTTRQGKKKPIVTNRDLAKQLGIAERTLISYKKYFASLDNPKIKLGKNDRKPPKRILDKISKIATSKKLKKTREAGKKYDKSEIENIKSLINPQTFKKLKKESQNKNWFGWLIRMHVLLIGKEGTYDQWFTFVSSIKTEKGLNNFLIGEVEKLLTSQQNLYQVSNILGFEILEIVINPTLKIDPSTPKASKGR